MPHIKSIRLVNIHFNNATQFYDDFLMKLEGKNATYDLENGGGKSLLLLLLLQTVLPKSHLRKEKPVSLLFQGGKDRTSHAAVEWILEEGSQYKYLLTGFCARKKKGSNETAVKDINEEDDHPQSGDIEHLNWCVFYNDNKLAGMKSVPLIREEAGKKSYAGFEDIRKYIQQMKQKGLPAEVFDGIDKYQSYISAHNLITAEWNIIRGINSGENNIESYFRQNATSRKLIENQFIKIVEDVEASNRGEKNNDESLLLADTLIEIRSRLNEYLRLKGHMSEFERIKDYYNEFGKRNDDLFSQFKAYENCKIDAAGIRNFIRDRLKKLENEKSEVIKQIEYNTASMKEGINLKKLLEAGLVQHGIDILAVEKEHLEEKKTLLTENQKEQESKFYQVMTLEGYGSYRKIRGKFLETEQSLSALESEGDDIDGQYRAAGGRLKYLVDKELTEDVSNMKKLQNTLKSINDDKNLNQASRITKEKEEASLSAELVPLEKREEVLEGKLKVLHSFFLESGEIDAVINPNEFLPKTEEQHSKYGSQHLNVTERIKAIESEVQILDLETVKNAGEIKQRNEAKKRDEDWLASYENELKELEKKALGFGKSKLWEYKEGLEVLIHRESLNKLEREIEIGRLRQKKQLSEERGYYVPNEEILSLTQQLNGKCMYVKAGIDWIADAELDAKEMLLKEMPYLPFSIIVDRKSFEKLKNNQLRLDFSSDYSVPIVNVETVQALKKPLTEDVFYFCSFSELILENSQYAQYIEGIETKLNNIHRKIAEDDSRIAELNVELLKVATFLENYAKVKVEAAAERVIETNKEVEVLAKRQTQVKEEKSRLLREQDVAKKQIENLSGLIQMCKDKLDKLRESIQIKEEQKSVREELSIKKKEQGAIKNAIKNIKAEADKIEKRYKSVQEEIGGLQIELHDLKNESTLLASFENIADDTRLEEVRAQYKALHDAVSGKISNETTLRKGILDCKNSLKELRERILRDYGEDLEQVEKNEDSGVQIIIPSQETIKKAKYDLEETGKKLKVVEDQIAKIIIQISNAEGKAEEILKGLPQEEKTGLPYYESQHRYEEEIQYTSQLIISYEDENNKLKITLEKTKEDFGKQSNQVEYYDSFIEREGVVNEGTISLDAKDFRVFEMEYRDLDKNIKIQCDKWADRIKTINEEAAAYIIRGPIEELAKISRPETSAQCQTRHEAFKEYIMNIEEQMQKISYDLLQLESYQQDFTRRCIQRAELVLGHLKKLESFSRIEVYGRRTNMIEMKLQEFEDKEKHLRMRTHIDGIVKEISENGLVDRKRVAAMLSTKELLAQITDMDKAAVRLYKIESIPENSKTYRWEQAIGSEGQNNSQYFIFAACLISFIRMLSITNTSLKTKKVIIADNPFGATSAVYLWDPMFKIMKQNDIQLIAPGHRIPREITSKFGVSYLLNQEILQDGRMRVVVKDVRVEEDEDLMRYVEPEQLSLF